MKLRSTLLSCLIFVMLPGCVADYGDSGPETGEPGTETPVAVWYATDRALGGGSSESKPGYSDGRGDIAYGVADVRLPPVHVAGRLEAPALASAGSVADRRWHVYLDSARPLERNAFMADLGSALDMAARREILVYIHGFNTDFGLSVGRAAQLAHDLGYGGLPLAFAWPSAGTMAGYLADQNNADWAAPDLAETLRLLARDSGAERINLIAHSMGSRLLIQALDELARGRAATDPPLFGEVIFAAPDVDSDIFATAVLRLRPLAGRFTLYVSGSDVALSTARRLAGDHPRAGESGAGMVVIADMDTVDASAVGDDLFGHEYFGESGPVLNDIRLLLEEGAGAADRPSLTREFHLGRSYWRLLPPVAPES
jgi:esterase/lipase superfamily enzyme